MKLARRLWLPVLGMLVAGNLSAQIPDSDPAGSIVGSVSHGAGGLSMTDGTASASVTVGGTTIGRLHGSDVRGVIGFWRPSAAAGVVASVTSPNDGTANTASNGISAAVYPNPFVSGTTLSYSINEPGHARIRLTDELGRTVRTLADAPRDPGTYRLDLSGEDLPSGFYRIVLETGSDRTSLNVVRVR